MQVRRSGIPGSNQTYKAVESGIKGRKIIYTGHLVRHTRTKQKSGLQNILTHTQDRIRALKVLSSEMDPVENRLIR